MSAVESMVVFFPRFTTLAGPTSFATPALDVSRFGGAQIRAWWGGMINGGTALKLHLEESLDGVDWPADAATTFTLSGTSTSRFFSYGFRLRWFRVRIEMVGAQDTMVTCWVEGILRAGGAGAREWQRPAPAAAAGPTILPTRPPEPGREPAREKRRSQPPGASPL